MHVQLTLLLTKKATHLDDELLDEHEEEDEELQHAYATCHCERKFCEIMNVRTKRVTVCSMEE